MMFMKAIVLFAALLSIVGAGVLHHVPALIHTGTSVSSRHQDGFGNFGFRYDIASAGAKTSHAEVGSSHLVTKVLAPTIYAAPAVYHAPVVYTPAVVPSVYAAHTSPFLGLGIAKPGLLAPAHLAYGGYLNKGKFIF